MHYNTLYCTIKLRTIMALYAKEYNHKIVFYSLVNGVGSSTIAYQLARLLRFPLYQEQKNDLVFFLKAVLDKKYSVGYFDEYDESEGEGEDTNNAVFDMKHIDVPLFRQATAIIVLTNNSYLDVLKTIATLQKIDSAINDNKKSIHVVFNRLQLGYADREKKYTNASKDLITSTLPHLNIKFSYIRTGFVFYRNIDEGRFFMDSFFKRGNGLFEEYESELKDVNHTNYLEMFFDNLYEGVKYDFEYLNEYERILFELQDRISLTESEKKKHITQHEKINQYIAKENFHQENIRLSKSAIRDMYSLLYKLGGIYEKTYTINGITKTRKKIEEN